MESNAWFWISCGKYLFPPLIEFEIFQTVRIGCPWNLESFFLSRTIEQAFLNGVTVLTKIDFFTKMWLFKFDIFNFVNMIEKG